MKLKTKNLKDSCIIIKNAIDTKGVSLYTETLELIAQGTTLYMNVTNREYYMSLVFNLEEETNFIASVNAKLFLDLISKITTDTIEMVADDKSVKIVGNGTYKIPMIYKGDDIMRLPVIKIDNVTNTMKIPATTLNSIAIHNSKELLRGIPVKPVQNYYYIDREGAITFTTGACVNYFNLEEDIKILLSDKVVKLFKLFKNTTDVDFSIGHDAVSEDIIETKVCFKAGGISITAILPDIGLVSSVPVTAIRGMASKTYSNVVVINKNELIDSLHRILLFSTDNHYGSFEFTNKNIIISDMTGDNIETVQFKDECNSLTSTYKATLNINALELIISGCEEDYLTICFGDGKALIIKKNNISDIIPELKVK